MSLLLDNYTIELGDDSGLVINKSVYDIIEPDKRKSSFTKTITIPATAQNNKAFADLFDVNFHLETDTQFDPFYNPSKKAPCFIHTEDEEQLTGYARLVSIVKREQRIEYNLEVYGEIRDLFATIQGSKLNELNLSAYNHLYTKDNIVDSWNNNIYINGALTPSEIGTGYVYPMVDYGDNHIRVTAGGTGNLVMDYWETTHFRPWVYVKTIVDEIFAQAGYKYYSEFFNSDIFKKLIYQGDVNGLTLTNDEIEELSVQGTRITSEQSFSINIPSTTGVRVSNYIAPLSCYTSRNIIFNDEIIDPSGQYETASGTTTLNTTTKYNLNYSIEVRVDAPASSINITLEKLRMKFGAVKSDGSVFLSFQHDLELTSFIAGDQYDFTIQYKISELPLNENEEFRLVFLGMETLFGTQVNTAGSLRVNIKTGSNYSLTPVTYLPVGGTVNISNVLSSSMTQKDFMMNLVKMFNLYIEPYNFDPNDENSGGYVTYLIEPRDQYYTSDVIDWTDKLDTNKDFTIKPVALSQYKQYHFTYAEDNDLLNDRYKGQTGRVYGDYTHIIDNDFAKDTKKIEIGFSPCIISDQSQPEHWTSREVPVNKTIDGEYRLDGKPKILFWQGEYGGESWNFEGEEYFNVPYAGQLDDRVNPTCDLNFKLPVVIYYKSDNNGEYTFTSGTLFNRYHYRGIEEINNRNSKIVECYMRLFPSDIHNLSFRPLYFIENAYYRLYEVVDHNYTDTTLCRFLKLSDVTGVSGAVWKSKGGRGVIGELDDDLPTRAPVVRNTKRVGLPDAELSGGTIGGGTVQGGYGEKLGSNILQGGTASGVIYKDNIIDLGYQYLNIASGSTTLNGTEGSPLYLICNTTDGDINIYLPDYSLNYGKIYKIYKTPPSNHIYVYDSDDALVHTISSAGASHEFLLTQEGVILLE